MTIDRPMFPPRAESVDSFFPQPAIAQPESGNLTGESSKPVRGLSRRHMLAGLAVLPAALPAAAEAAADPIHAAIERHKQTAAVWDAAVHARSNFNDLHMTAEQREQRDELDDAVEDAWMPCRQAGVDLINTAPTTSAGIIAAIAYIRIQMRDDGTYMPHHLILETGGDAQETMGWIDAFLSGATIRMFPSRLSRYIPGDDRGRCGRSRKGGALGACGDSLPPHHAPRPDPPSAIPRLAIH
jgi:hypothetical protein